MQFNPKKRFDPTRTHVHVYPRRHQPRGKVVWCRGWAISDETIIRNSAESRVGLKAHPSLNVRLYKTGHLGMIELYSTGAHPFVRSSVAACLTSE